LGRGRPFRAKAFLDLDHPFLKPKTHRFIFDLRDERFDPAQTKPDDTAHGIGFGNFDGNLGKIGLGAANDFELGDQIIGRLQQGPFLVESELNGLGQTLFAQGIRNFRKTLRPSADHVGGWRVGGQAK
jgi:hypothetical protein